MRGLIADRVLRTIWRALVSKTDRRNFKLTKRVRRNLSTLYTYKIGTRAIFVIVFCVARFGFSLSRGNLGWFERTNSRYAGHGRNRFRKSLFAPRRIVLTDDTGPSNGYVQDVGIVNVVNALSHPDRRFGCSTESPRIYCPGHFR